MFVIDYYNCAAQVIQLVRLKSNVHYMKRLFRLMLELVSLFYTYVSRDLKIKNKK